jgi:cystathionine beta-lyase
VTRKRVRAAPPAHWATDTRVAHLGSGAEGFGSMNPPLFRVSTVAFDSMADYERAYAERFGELIYGRVGTPTTWAFEDAVAGLEGGAAAFLLPSGLAAISAALLSQLRAGDHLLMVDTVYGPARAFCDNILPRYGIETTFYDPLIGAGIEALMRPATRVVYAESPGSQTFEVQDVRAIAEAAHRRGAVLMLDNTWATPLGFRSFDHGVDIAVHAATKYLVGHSDAMLGVIVANEATRAPVREWVDANGLCAGADEAWLGLRGLRTLSVRLARHHENALAVARWLEQRPEVARVLHPGLPSNPGHALWTRDFRLASGLFSIVLHPYGKAAVDAFVDGLELFAIGASWGGYESLVMPFAPAKIRSATRWQDPGACVRFHVGLEDPADLIRDLERGFERLRKAEGR